MFTSLHKTLVSHHRNNIATAAAAAAVTTVTAMILSDATMGITIIEIKSRAALKAAYEHLSAAATWVVIYFCVVT
jgi:hypothetical protein